jgi:predicted neuraminidase
MRSIAIFLLAVGCAGAAPRRPAGVLVPRLQRYSLVAAVSGDEGATWKWKRHLDGSPAAQSASQYHYPSVIQARDGAIHVTYSYFTAQGKAIKHVRFEEAWVKAGD